MPFLSVSGVSHSFGDRPVLQDVSFEVEGGEVLTHPVSGRLLILPKR